MTSDADASPDGLKPSTLTAVFLLDPDIFPWDLAILLLMSLGLAVAFVCWSWRRRSPRRSFWLRGLVGILGTLGLLGSALTAYGSFIEPRLIVTSHFTVPLSLQKPLRIAVASDFHVGPYTGEADVRRVVERINETLPDLILLPGDFIATPRSDLSALAPLKRLRSSLGTFAILGNHDMARYQTIFGRAYVRSAEIEALKAALKDLGITVLQNQRRTITLPEGTLVVAGIDDLWSGTSDIARALEGVPADAATILLVHNPDIILDPRSQVADVIVAGHTHGGQLRLPFIGSLAPIPNKLGGAYDQGIFPLPGGRALAITRGVGTTLARARLFAWPEVMVLETQ